VNTETFDFVGADGQHLSGRLDLPDHPPHTYALFAHCFTCTKNSLAAVRIARALTANGLGVLRFDFTGLGQSGGDFADTTFSGNIRDLAAAVHAMEIARRTPTLLIGHSLGGAAALAAAPDLVDITAVAVIAAPFDVNHVSHLFGGDLQAVLDAGEAEVNLGGRPFKIRRAFVEDLNDQNQAERIANIRRPLLILHSPQDRTVAIDNATEIFRAARHPKSFVSLSGADHLLTKTADAIYAADVIAVWASRYLNAAQDGMSDAFHGDAPAPSPE
jgi:alpha-beta hydrolase superfamily lysophospholipase